MRAAPTKMSLCALVCLVATLAVGAEIYFEENFPDGMYIIIDCSYCGECLFDVIILFRRFV